MNPRISKPRVGGSNPPGRANKSTIQYNLKMNEKRNSKINNNVSLFLNFKKLFNCIYAVYFHAPKGFEPPTLGLEMRGS